MKTGMISLMWLILAFLPLMRSEKLLAFELLFDEHSYINLLIIQYAGSGCCPAYGETQH